MSPKQDLVEPDINLKIETTNKNKEIIIQSLLKDGDIFSISFGDEDSYVLENNILNSDLKYFCKSLAEEEREVLEKTIFKSKKDVNKKVFVIYSENYKNIASFLRNKYPEEEYFMITPEDFDAQIKEMQNQINKEAGSDVEDGGIDIPPDSDGITRIPADDDNGGNNE